MRFLKANRSLCGQLRPHPLHTFLHLTVYILNEILQTRVVQAHIFNGRNAYFWFQTSRSTEEKLYFPMNRPKHIAVVDIFDNKCARLCVFEDVLHIHNMCNLETVTTEHAQSDCSLVHEVSGTKMYY